MVHYMPGDRGGSEDDPGAAPEPAPSTVGRVAAAELTPRQIVEHLDMHVVGQAAAKRAVAIAIRSRLRRQAVGGALGHDISPKNILMIGPTGVGKTEIARRIARLTDSPFVKVEASKYTEVGYVGRDVESMIRDLAAVAVQQVRKEQEDDVRLCATQRAEDRLIDLIVPPGGTGIDASAVERRREAIRSQLRAALLDERRVDLDVTEPSKMPGLSMFGQGSEAMDLSSMLSGLMPTQRKRKNLSVKEAREFLEAEEASKLVDDDRIGKLAIERAESSGIVFIDEIDKVAGREGGHGPDISREGVQRDLLPIIEGTTVQTKWGPLRTDHVLFIAAGAFHVSKPSDLIPELQGRLPIRVELTALGQPELVRILTEPSSSLTAQARALLATEGVDLEFTPDGVEAIAEYAARVNAQAEDIGARRLATLLESVLDDISFEGEACAGTRVVIDAALVRGKLEPIVVDQDITRYVL